jgi:hypothetical protein
VCYFELKFDVANLYMHPLSSGMAIYRPLSPFFAPGMCCKSKHINIWSEELHLYGLQAGLERFLTCVHQPTIEATKPQSHPACMEGEGRSILVQRKLYCNAHAKWVPPIEITAEERVQRGDSCRPKNAFRLLRGATTNLPCQRPYAINASSLYTITRLSLPPKARCKKYTGVGMGSG